MSTYYINQNFSLRDRFTIKNENQQDVFYAEGKWLSFGKQITLQTLNGEDLLLVKEKVFRWLSHYEFYVGDQLVGEIKRELSLLQPRYRMIAPAWTIQGDIWSHHYEIKENQQLIAEISKKFLSFMDAYEIKIHQEASVELVLGIVIAIDADLAKQDQ